MKSLVQVLCHVTVVLLVAGCKSYTEKMEVLKKEISLDCQIAKYNAYDTKRVNRLLALQERGRLCQLKGDWSGSANEYRKAIDCLFTMRETKPDISVSDTLKSAIASTYGNDLAKDYAPSAFDQMMLHTLDAFNCFALGEWDGFGVHARNLETWRNEATVFIKRDAKTLQKTGASSNNSTANDLFKANAVNHSTDNIYSLYLIGLYHEIIGDTSNAIKAYRDIERIRFGTATVKETLKSLDTAMKPGKGEVIVFLEEGFIPPKREVKSYVGGILTSAMPAYISFDCMPFEDGGPLIISENKHQIAGTRLLCDLAPLAAKSLEECMRGIIARQIARSSIKIMTKVGLTAATISSVVASSGGDNKGAVILAGAAALGVLAMSIYAEASERADLRSWLLLPRQVQIARFTMDVGKHQLQLSTAGIRENVVAEVKNGEKTIIYCIALPNAMRTFSACLDKIK
ncbi:MAG: hypothetical protein IJS08_08595 [Victivallales bacterium]|nr:hypothetical protein [Victivallales bacterium]